MVIEGAVLKFDGLISHGRCRLEDELELLAKRAELADHEVLLVAITNFPAPTASLVVAGRGAGRMAFWEPGQTAHVQADPEVHREPVELRVTRVSASTAHLLDPTPTERD